MTSLNKLEKPKLPPRELRNLRDLIERGEANSIESAGAPPVITIPTGESSPITPAVAIKQLAEQTGHPLIPVAVDLRGARHSHVWEDNINSRFPPLHLAERFLPRAAIISIDEKTPPNAVGSILMRLKTLPHHERAKPTVVVITGPSKSLAGILQQRGIVDYLLDTSHLQISSPAGLISNPEKETIEDMLADKINRLKQLHESFYEAGLSKTISYRNFLRLLIDHTSPAPREDDTHLGQLREEFKKMLNAEELTEPDIANLWVSVRGVLTSRRRITDTLPEEMREPPLHAPEESRGLLAEELFFLLESLTAEELRAFWELATERDDLYMGAKNIGLVNWREVANRNGDMNNFLRRLTKSFKDYLAYLVISGRPIPQHLENIIRSWKIQSTDYLHGYRHKDILSSPGFLSLIRHVAEALLLIRSYNPHTSVLTLVETTDLVGDTRTQLTRYIERVLTSASGASESDLKALAILEELFGNYDLYLGSSDQPDELIQTHIRKAREQIENLYAREIKTPRHLLEYISKRVDELEGGESLLLIGPSGVGRTRTALNLLSTHYGDSKYLIDGQIYHWEDLDRIRGRIDGFTRQPDFSSRGSLLVIDNIHYFPPQKLRDILTYVREKGIKTVLITRPDAISNSAYEELLGQLPTIQLCPGNLTNHKCGPLPARRVDRVFLTKEYFTSIIEGLTNRWRDNTIAQLIEKIPWNDIHEMAERRGSYIMALLEWIQNNLPDF